MRARSHPRACRRRKYTQPFAAGSGSMRGAGDVCRATRRRSRERHALNVRDAAGFASSRRDRNRSRHAGAYSLAPAYDMRDRAPPDAAYVADVPVPARLHRRRDRDSPSRDHRGRSILAIATPLREHRHRARREIHAHEIALASHAAIGDRVCRRSGDTSPCRMPAPCVTRRTLARRPVPHEEIAAIRAVAARGEPREQHVNRHPERIAARRTTSRRARRAPPTMRSGRGRDCTAATSSGSSARARAAAARAPVSARGGASDQITTCGARFGSCSTIASSESSREIAGAPVAPVQSLHELSLAGARGRVRADASRTRGLRDRRRA